VRDFGIVYIAWNDLGFYSGYWEREPDGPPADLEEMPHTASPAEAVRWGRSRARRVFDQAGVRSEALLLGRDG